jgi:hypothetical protein
VGYIKNFTRMSPSEFEFFINLIGEKISKKDTAFRKDISVQERLALTHSLTGLFISFPRSSHASCFLILLKCVGCFGSQTICFLLQSSLNSTTLSWVHSISQLSKCSTNRTVLQIRTTLQDRSIRNGKKMRGADSDDVSCCTSRPAQAVTVSSLWRDGQILTGHRTCP